MKDNLITVLLTTGLFAAGMITGIWTQHLHPSSFGTSSKQESGSTAQENYHHFPAQVISQMHERAQRLKPALESYKVKVEAIKAQYRTQVELLLTETQKNQYHQFLINLETRDNQLHPPDSKSLRTLINSSARVVGPIGLDNSLMSLLIYKPTLEMISDKLLLSPLQKDQLQALFISRRAALLALVDSETPPSLLIMNLPYE